jgi:hypothetical protein
LEYVCGVHGSPHWLLQVYVNEGVFIDDPKVAKVLGLWEDYLSSRPDSVYDNPYWMTKEKSRYHTFDMLSAGPIHPSLYMFDGSFKPTVLSVAQEGADWRIGTMFAQCNDSGFSSPIAIVEVIASPEKGMLKLRNALSVNTLTWQHHRVGSVNFICPGDYPYDVSKARRLNRFIDNLTSKWSIPPVRVDYYYATTLDQVETAQGFAYLMGYGNSSAPSGRAQPDNRIVVSGGLGEYYPHEFVHVYLQPLYPHAHAYFQEGYATVLGGSRGMSLKELLKNADAYLHAHPEFDIDSLLHSPDPSVNLSYTTNTTYAFGGLFCMKAERRGGLAALKKLFSYPDTPKGLADALRDTLDIAEGKAGLWVRQYVSKEANAP